MEKERNHIVGFYILFAAGIIMDFIPIIIIEQMGLCVALVAIVAAYIYRWRADNDSLTYNHMSFLITTFWASSVILLVGIVLAIAVIYKAGNHTLIADLVDAHRNGEILTEQRMQITFTDYVRVNWKLLLAVSIPTLGPGVIYLIYRVGQGMHRAVHGHRIARPKAWL